MADARKADQEHAGNWHILLAGLPKPDAPTTLAPGLTLVPLDAPLSVFDLAAAGAAGFRTWAVLEPVAGACTCEIEAAKDSATTPGYDTLNRAWLACGLLVLRGYSRHLALACSSYSWNQIAGHQKRTAPAFHEQLRREGVDAAVYRPAAERSLPTFLGNILDFHLQVLTVPDANTGPLDVADADWIRQRFAKFNQLCAESDTFRLALESAVDWRFAKDPRAAVARLWAGIETIFGISSELVYRISLLSASLLEPRGERRRDRFDAVRKLYNLRSKAVHGEPLKDEALIGAMTDSFNLLRALLLATIDKGHVLGAEDFDEAVFC